MYLVMRRELDKLETKYKKGKLSDTDFGKMGPELESKNWRKGHNLTYIGRVGQFTPVIQILAEALYRVDNGTKIRSLRQYRGIAGRNQSLKTLGLEKDIDRVLYKTCG